MWNSFQHRFFWFLKTKTYKQNGTNLSCLFTKKKKKQCGFKNLFFQNSKNVFIAGFGEITFPSEKKGQMVPPLFRKKKDILFRRKPREVSPLRNVLDFFFPLYKVYQKKHWFFFFLLEKWQKRPKQKPCHSHQNTSLVICTGAELELTLVVSLFLVKGVVLRVQVGPQSSSAKTKVNPDAFVLFFLNFFFLFFCLPSSQCFSAASGHKVQLGHRTL